MEDFYQYSVPQLVRMLGTRFKEYRMRVGMTQKDVSKQSGITITTIHNFESGTSYNISLGTLILLMKAIGMVDNIDKLMPELPESPYMYKAHKKIQRIRH